MELIKIMKKINRLERVIEVRSDNLDMRYKMLICKKCILPATYMLVQGLGEFPNYLETFICDKCARYVNSFNSFQLDIIGFVDLYKLT